MPNTDDIPKPVVAISAALVAVAVLASPRIAAAADDAGATPEPDATPRSDAGNSGTFEAGLSQRFAAPDTPRVGDSLRLILTVHHPPNADVRTGLSFEESSRWSLADSNTSTRGGEADRRTRIEYVLQVFRPGRTTLEPFPVVVERDDRRARLRTDPVTIDVASTISTPTEAEFSGPLPPATVTVSDYTWVWVGGSAATLLVVLAGLLLWRRRETKGTPEPTRPAEEIALDHLRKLRDSGRIERGDIKYVYVRMSLHVRRYLGRRFDFPGAEMTTAEVLFELEGRSWPDDLTFDEIIDWFRHVDRVKFSGLEPDADRAEAALETAIALVDRTRPERFSSAETDETDANGEEPT